MEQHTWADYQEFHGRIMPIVSMSGFVGAGPSFARQNGRIVSTQDGSPNASASKGMLGVRACSR